MELADIAIAVKGNDKESKKLDDNELEGGETVGRAEMEREADAKTPTVMIRLARVKLRTRNSWLVPSM